MYCIGKRGQMNAGDILRYGSVEEIIETIGGDVALKQLEQSIQTLNKHHQALEYARDQLIVKKTNIQTYLYPPPFEAEDQIEV